MKTLGRTVSVFFIAVGGGLVALTLNNHYTKYHSMKQEELKSVARLTNKVPVLIRTGGIVNPEGNNDFVSAAQKDVPAVVYIEGKVQMEEQRGYNSIWDFFYGPQSPAIVQGEVSGSGVIVSPDGYIVTNNHVVDEAGHIRVTLSNRQTYSAKIIGQDPETDIALLKIDATNLPYMEYGNSDDVLVGQWVLAIGNPYNLTSTVTAGIVSAKGRNIDILPRSHNIGASQLYPIESYIQTDAAVNPGNSGGALVNTSGQLIGINSAIASTTGSFTGYSFAVPVNLVRKVVADLLKYKVVQRAFLGVTISNVDADVASKFSLKSTQGVYVEEVKQGGAAQAAGIRNGDVITKVGEQTVNDVPSLEEQVGNYRPGDKVNITIERSNNEMVIPVKLRNLEGTTSIVNAETEPNTASIASLGATLSEVSKDEMDRLNIKNGVKIVGLSRGKLSEVGVHNGFIITKINHTPVNTVTDIEAALGQAEGGGVLVEGIYPDGTKGYYAFGS